MRFDGMNFRNNKNYVSLPPAYWSGEPKCYMTFGKIVPKETSGAIETTWYHEEWLEEGKVKTPIWATPVQEDGHSLTNMMFGITSYGRRMIFLQFKGKIFTAPLPPRRNRG